MRPTAAVAAGVLVLLGLAGCARTSSAAPDSSVSSAPTSTSLSTSTSPSAPDGAAPCDGVTAPPTPVRLRAGQKIAAVVVCRSSRRYVAGRGQVAVDEVVALGPAGVAALQSGLTQPDAVAPAVCSSEGYLIPDFTVTLSDGTRLRPGIPSDGCHPRRDVLAALADPAGTRVLGTTLGPVLAPDVVARSNCATAAKGPVVWASLHAPPASLPHRPTSGSISVCRYAGDLGGASLTAVGIVPADSAATAWPATVRPAATEPCPADGSAPGAASTFLFLLTTPPVPRPTGPDGSDMIAMAEIDGCHRFLAAGGGMIGYLSSAQVGALAALATDPVR